MIIFVLAYLSLQSHVTVLSRINMALFCNLGYEGIKTLRECCGGAGFSKLSNFGSQIDVASALVTLEGDSVVMNL